MNRPIKTGGIHHITLTVSDILRSTKFYAQHIGFQVLVEFAPRIALSNGSLLLLLTSPRDPDQLIFNDRFNENRIGLDHLSLSVNSRAELERQLPISTSKALNTVKSKTWVRMLNQWENWIVAVVRKFPTLAQQVGSQTNPSDY